MMSLEGDEQTNRELGSVQGKYTDHDGIIQTGDILTVSTNKICFKGEDHKQVYLPKVLSVSIEFKLGNILQNYSHTAYRPRS